MLICNSQSGQGFNSTDDCFRIAFLFFLSHTQWDETILHKLSFYLLVFRSFITTTRVWFIRCRLFVQRSDHCTLDTSVCESDLHFLITHTAPFNINRIQTQEQQSTNVPDGGCKPALLPSLLKYRGGKHSEG